MEDFTLKYCQIPKLLITLTTKVILIGGVDLRQPIHIVNNPTLLYVPKMERICLGPWT